MKLIVISGRSGSGKSVVLRALEDLGYYCVDNLPVSMLPTLTHAVVSEYDQIAVSIDVRNLPKDPEQLTENLDFLPNKTDLTIIYLDASDDILVKRYSETRRLHPLSKNNISLADAIVKERELLVPIYERADLHIDTDKLSIHQLAELVRERILGKKSSRLVLVFESFGFKNGIPKDADYVFDVRFLPNPHWIPELKPYSGKDAPVAQYLTAQPIVVKVIGQFQNLIETWLPHLERNNRSYVTVAIGCTGGQHRSVFIAETLANYFSVAHPDVQIRHRDLDA
ncbi:RNase adapter RapZ [Planctobacterium marinum]|uniref:RNase adapter RapZ n=1 Tax=Planctobacterium marinum TaxID=1631968 RepID=UPI001E488F66|nr:RNase adapter RapZ [Planctobacterium marinum]MCC2604857.1 RNase adapter RapZ [Planctobacterium marinum]